MVLVCCVDDRGGMAFHGRRQSMDRVLRSDLLATAAGRPLWMSPYSAAQFSPQTSVSVSEDFLDRAGPEELCFVELCSPAPWLDRAEGLILYRWNRTYPFDVALGFDPEKAGFFLTERTDFPGHSHPKLTKEVYQR